jgi:hypothetical protein
MISKTRNPGKGKNVPVVIEGDEPERLTFPVEDEIPPEPAPVPKAHARVYHVGSMRFSVKEAPLRDSPRGELVQRYKDILKRGRKPAGTTIPDEDTHEPPRRPAGSRPPRPDLPMGFPRFRHEKPEPFADDDEED